jgi:transcriptional regulator with XRE-family HTH domain
MPSDSMGNRIKKRRAEIGLSLRELADKTDLTASFISQVERNQTKPSIDSLRRIAEALNVSILFFLADHARPRAISARRAPSLQYSPVVRAHARSKLILPVSGLTYELLVTDLARQMEAFSGRLSPRTGNVARRLRAPTEEFIYVLSGALCVGLDDEEHTLCSGDSIYFDGTTLQKLECASADEDAVWISVITPPVF